jgi:hypothetical protein
VSLPRLPTGLRIYPEKAAPSRCLGVHELRRGSMWKKSYSEINYYADTKNMKKAARVRPSLLVDIATLKAMAENFLDILEQGVGPEDPRVWKRPLVKWNKKGEEKTYYRWYCSWHDGNKTITEYLGKYMLISLVFIVGISLALSFSFFKATL